MKSTDTVPTRVIRDLYTAKSSAQEHLAQLITPSFYVLNSRFYFFVVVHYFICYFIIIY